MEDEELRAIRAREYWRTHEAIGRWHQFAVDTINLIGDWRDDPAGYFARFPDIEVLAQQEDPDWERDDPDWKLYQFQADTERLGLEAGVLKLDPAPLWNFYAPLSAWFKDQDARRVPGMAELHAMHDRALFIVRAVDFAPGMKRVREAKPEPVPTSEEPIGWLVGSRRDLNRALGMGATYGDYLERQVRLGVLKLERLGDDGPFRILIHDESRRREAAARLAKLKGQDYTCM